MSSSTRNLLAAAAALTALAGATEARAQTARALDVWGRYVTAFDLHWAPKGNVMNYVPKANFLMLVEGAESDDKITAQFSAGGKPLGPPVRCDISVEKLAGSELAVVSSYGCKPDLEKHALAKPAKLAVEVGYRRTAMGKDHPALARYELEVKPHSGPNGSKEFHVDQDLHLSEAWIHLAQDGTGLNIFTWFKSSHDEKTSVSSAKMRCFVGTKKWEFAEQVNTRWEYEFDDYAKAKKSGRADKSRWSYAAFFPNGNGQAFLRDNPGDYRCVITRNGEADRELTFAVADGKPVKPPCQAGDVPLVSAPDSTTMIKVAFKTPQDAPFDAKAASAALYGRAGVAKACGF